MSNPKDTCECGRAKCAGAERCRKCAAKPRVGKRCECGQKIGAASTRCFACYLIHRKAASPQQANRCGCGKVIQDVSTQCRRCYQKSRNPQPPTPAEIRAACLEIQATWSKEQEQIRRGGRGEGWSVPVVEAWCDE